MSARHTVSGTSSATAAGLISKGASDPAKPKSQSAGRVDNALGDLRNKISAHGSASETSIRKASMLGATRRVWMVESANRANIATNTMRSTTSSTEIA